jgi:hypothetical protein
MELTSPKHCNSPEKAEQALAVFASQLPLLSQYANLAWDPFYGGWVGSILSRTINYCDIIISSETASLEIRLQAVDIKSLYQQQLDRYNKSNFHFQFYPKSISEYEKPV